MQCLDYEWMLKDIIKMKEERIEKLKKEIQTLRDEKNEIEIKLLKLGNNE